MTGDMAGGGRRSGAAAQAEEMLLEYARVQDWPFLLQDDALVHKKKSMLNKTVWKGGRRGKEEEPPTNAIILTVELRELRRNRDGKYLYEKLLKASPENLFPDPKYYVLRYRLPSAPFEVEVSLGDNEQITSAFHQFKQLMTRNLHEKSFFLIRVYAREASAPFFNPVPVKKYKDISFRTRGNLVRMINEHYLEGKLTLPNASKLLSMEMPQLQREVYLMLPLQDKEDHQYLIEEKPKPAPSPHARYMAGHINLSEYEDEINPEKKEKRLEAERGYPLPEEPQVCVVCHQVKAFIPCLQCPNRVCTQCMYSTFLRSPDQTSFILLHHAFCRKHGGAKKTSTK